MKPPVLIYKNSNRFYFDNLKGNVKQFLRLTTTVAPAKTVLGIRKAVLDKAGVGSFANELRGNGYEVVNKKNMRYGVSVLQLQF